MKYIRVNKSIRKCSALSGILVLSVVSSARGDAPAFPVGFPDGAWNALRSSERTKLEEWFESATDNGTPFELALLSCNDSNDAATQATVKYILIMTLEQDLPPHTCIHLLNPQGQSLHRIPAGIDPPVDIKGDRNFESCRLFSANGGARILALSAPSSNKRGTDVEPDIYMFLQWTQGQQAKIAFEYKALGDKKWTAGGAEHEALIHWRSKMTWKDLDGVAGKEIVIRRLVQVVENGNVIEKYLEDAVLAWNLTTSKFENVTATIAGDVHAKVKEAIVNAVAADVYVAEGPGINFEARADFENLTIEARSATDTLPIAPATTAP